MNKHDIKASFKKQQLEQNMEQLLCFRIEKNMNKACLTNVEKKSWEMRRNRSWN